MLRNRLGNKLWALVLVAVMGCATLMMGLSSVAYAANEVEIQMHGGEGLTFHFYFSYPPDNDPDDLYEVVVSGTGSGVSKSGPTELGIGYVLEYVEIYSGSLFVEEVLPSQIAHRSDNQARLVDDGSMQRNNGRVEQNTGTVNFWYRGGAAETLVTIEAEKIGIGAPLTDGLFSFGLYNSSGVRIGTATNDADGNIVFDPIRFTEYDAEGDYFYTISEDSLGGGRWICDDTVYQIKITVYLLSGDTRSNTVVIAVIDYGDEPVVFTNTYIPPRIETDPSLVLEGTKNVEGARLVSGMFTFVVIDADGNTVATGTNDIDGNIVFTPITYTEDGEYTYTVKEVNQTGAGWKYDRTEYTVSVTVYFYPDQDAYELDVTYPDDGLVFTNVYTPPATPKTGDIAILLVCIAGCMVLSGSVVLMRRKSTSL
ncbi:MAG: hypothetical protein FWH40_03910 [Coriobacteriia bacterium]|nr:hypothetical protein [Coriobacteriia bacterium]MCL2136652.1 hypothetical protein [Coriobacteriia bacterium]